MSERRLADVEDALLEAVEATTTLCEWFGQREAGVRTTNTEAALFQRVSNLSARLEALFDLAMPSPSNPQQGEER